MMTIDDLRIGDWVKTPSGYRQVEELSTKNCLLNWSDYGCTLDDVEPVLLTEEIIESNLSMCQGLLKWFKGWNTKDEWWFNLAGDNGEMYLHTYYVHELQHALKAVGIKEEIIKI